MANEIVCQHNKYGFCKYKENCKFRHVAEICEVENCDVESCLQRHPRQCRFYREFERCKFSEYCLFSHTRAPKKKNDELETVKARMEMLEKKSVEMTSVLNEKCREIKGLEIRLNEIDAKCDAAVETCNLIAKEVTEVVTIAFTKKQDAFEKQNSTRFDALDQQLLALVSLLKTSSSSVHQPQNSQQSPQHSQQTSLQPKLHHQKSRTTHSNQSQQLPGLSLRNSLERNHSHDCNVKSTCDLCGQTFDTDRAKKNHVRNYHQTQPYTT